MKYEAIADHFNNEIKIVIVAPHSESDSRIQRLQTQYPRVRIVKESHQEPLWGWLKVRHNDGLIFDRCGRLAKVLQLPSEGIESSNLVFDSFKSVLRGQPCGYCSYDRADSRVQPTPHLIIPMITAYVSPVSKTEDEARQNYYKKNQQEERRQKSNPSHNPNPRSNIYQENERRRQNSYNNPQEDARRRQNSNYNHNPNPYVNPRYNPQEDSRRQQHSNSRQNNQEDSRRQNSNQRSNIPQNGKDKQTQIEEFESVTVDYRRESSEGKIFAQQQQPGVYNNDWVEVDSKSKFGRLSDGSMKKSNTSDSPQKNGSSKTTDSLTNTDSSTQATPEKLDSFYSDSDDPASESDYYDYVADLTTPNPEQVQIPKPSSPSPFWPTMIPIAAAGSGQNCAGYNDDICYQQFIQLDDSEVHPCCKRKVVLTDQCVPGKCSNVTQQLCCIQKFLQAKLTCCLDEKQMTPTSATDKFSKCCHDHFITSDDSCCTNSYATAQWKSVHELCLPNVKIDLSDVKAKTYVPGTSVTTDFDFKFTKRWDFECKYGHHVPQYSYFENW